MLQSTYFLHYFSCLLTYFTYRSIFYNILIYSGVHVSVYISTPIVWSHNRWINSSRTASQQQNRIQSRLMSILLTGYGSIWFRKRHTVAHSKRRQVNGAALWCQLLERSQRQRCRCCTVRSRQHLVVAFRRKATGYRNVSGRRRRLASVVEQRRILALQIFHYVVHVEPVACRAGGRIDGIFCTIGTAAARRVRSLGKTDRVGGRGTRLAAAAVICGWRRQRILRDVTAGICQRRRFFPVTSTNQNNATQQWSPQTITSK